MSQTKVQLIAPIGVVTATTLETTGVLTATTFVGDIAGTVTGITSTTDNLDVGIVSATAFVGDFTGTASSIVSGSNVAAGIITGTKFVGNATGTVVDLADDTNINVGILTSTSFVGDLTGNAAGLSTTTANLSLGIVTATSFAGNLTGNAAGISVTTTNVTLGIITASAFHGDGGSLSGVSGGPVGQQVVNANSGTTSIDLSSGNLIYFNQSANTTVSFANTEGSTDVVYFVRVKDASGTERTITWPSGFAWDGGTEPTLLNANDVDEGQVFKLTTRDNGVTWYGVEIYNNPGGGQLWAWGRNQQGILGQNEQNPGGYSSPVQVGSDSGWKYVWSASYSQNVWAKKTDGTMWAWGYGQRGSVNYNISNRQQSSPVQYPGTTWSNNFAGTAIHRFQTKTDGTLWVVGSGEYGDLAQNNRTYYSSPVQIPGTNWSTDYGKIIALEQDKGGGCIKTNGELWMWGRNSQGTLAQNHTNMRSSPVQVPGTNWEFLVQNSNWRVAGATKTDGTLWMWGSGSNGSMGQNSPQNSYSSPIQIPGTTWTGNFTMNNAWSIAVKSDGTMWGWGNNAGGLLGQNSRTYYSSPVQVPGTTWSTVTSVGNAIAFATKTDGTLWGWGSQPASQFNDFLNTSTTGISAPGQTAYSSPVQILGAWGHSKGQLAAANSGAVFAIKP